MSDLLKELEEKKHQLAEIKASLPTAGCVETHSTGTIMQREMEMDDLEFEIKQLQEKIADQK